MLEFVFNQRQACSIKEPPHEPLFLKQSLAKCRISIKLETKEFYPLRDRSLTLC